MDLLYPFGGALVAPFAAMYVASILCRVQVKYGKRPSWLAVLVSLSVGIVVAWFCSFRLDAFRPGRWSSAGGKTQLKWLMGVVAVVSFFTSALPVGFVVDRFQKRYDKANPQI